MAAAPATAPATTTAAAAADGKKTYSLADLKAHATETSCWILVHGRVFDVTSFLEEHPGGFDIIISNTGAFFFLSSAGARRAALQVEPGRWRRASSRPHAPLAHGAIDLFTTRLGRMTGPATWRRAPGRRFFVLLRAAAHAARLRRASSLLARPTPARLDAR
jgi:hypothetical protein